MYLNCPSALLLRDVILLNAMEQNSQSRSKGNKGMF